MKERCKVVTGRKYRSTIKRLHGGDTVATLPQRRAGDRALSVIPIDVYALIFDYLEAPDDIYLTRWIKAAWKSLALVCRYFHTVFVARMFNTLLFNSICMYPYKRGKSRAFQFCRSISSRNMGAKYLAQEIIYCRLLGLDAISIVVGAIPLMTNVTYFTVSTGRIDKAFIQAVPQLTNLVSLQLIEGCRFSRRLSEDRVLGLSKLTRLTKFGLITNADYSAAVENGLYRCISSWKLRSLTMESGDLLRRVFSSDKRLQLEDLEVHVDGKIIAPLTSFLDITPSLKALVIRERHSRDANPNAVFPRSINLQSSALPALATLSCPLGWAENLVTGRQVQDLEFFYIPVTPLEWMEMEDEGICNTLFSCIGKSSRVVNLRIPARYHPYLAKSLQKSGSNLVIERLKLSDFHSVRQIIEREHVVEDDEPDNANAYLTSVSRMLLSVFHVATPRVLHVDMKEFLSWKHLLDLQCQHHFITTFIAIGFPDAVRISIMCVDWERDAAGRWTAGIFKYRPRDLSACPVMIPTSDWDRVFLFYLGRQPLDKLPVTDFEGALERFFPPGHRIYNMLRSDSSSSDVIITTPP